MSQTASPFRGKATGDVQGLDAQEVRRALGLFLDPAHSAELRGLPGGKSRVRRGDDIDGLAAAALELSDGKGVYFALNPLSIPPGEDRAAKVADVVSRRWLLVDIDPRRPADSNSTSAEHDQAMATAHHVRDWLEERGWPESVEVDSGNGWHLLYRVDLPCGKETQTLLRQFLHALGERFDSPAVEVDPKVHNAGRISKLPGTWARKGPHSAERPHRMCRLFHAPECVQIVDRALIESVAGEAAETVPTTEATGETAAPVPPTNGHGSPFTGKATGDGDGRGAYARKALEAEAGRVATAADGNRNNQLNISALALGELVGAGLLAEADVVNALLLAAGRAGLGEVESRATIRSGMEAGKLQPRQVPERNGQTRTAGAAPAVPEEWEPIVPLWDAPQAPPFPLEVFPYDLRRFAAEAAWATSAPVDFVALPMLAVASGAIGNSKRLMITRTHYQPALLFACVVGDPGSGKSPALELAAAPLEVAQRRAFAEYEREKKRLKLFAEQGADVEEPGPPRRLLVDNITSEELVAALSRNPRGLTQVLDELSGLFSGMNQYKAGGKGNDRQQLLRMWAQATIRNDRKHQNGMPITVYHPFLTVVGGTQPDVVASLRGEAMKPGQTPPNDGLLDRFLFAFPEPTPAGEETWRELSDPLAHRWQAIVDILLGEAMIPPSDEQPARPALLHLSPCGRDAWQRFTRDHASELNDPDFPEFLKGPWAKLKGYGGRLALVLHLLRRASGENCLTGVAGEDVDGAATLVAYFKSHAKKVLAVMDADPVICRVKRILRWFDRERRTEFKRRDLFMDVKSQLYFPTMDSLGPALGRLAKHNYIRVKTGSKSTGGRPEAEVYEIHPYRSTESTESTKGGPEGSE